MKQKNSVGDSDHIERLVIYGDKTLPCSCSWTVT